MNNIISVIIAFYNGEKYLDEIFTYIRANARSLSEKGYHLELVIVNDNAGKALDITNPHQDDYDLVIINNRENLGTHGSRVRGVESCHGDHVIFVDQDDLLTDDALIKHMEHIGDCDVSVSNAIDEVGGSHRIYRNERCQRLAAKLRPYLIYHIMALTGNCLIKKSSLPTVWMKGRLHINGADDELLFIAMLLDHRRFTTFMDVTFIHRDTGENQSSDIAQMARSSLEAYELLLEYYPSESHRLAIYRKRKQMIIDRSVNHSRSVYLKHPVITAQLIGYKMVGK